MRHSLKTQNHPNRSWQILSVNRSTVYRYLAKKELKARQFRGKTIIRRTDIDKMFDEAPDYSKRKNSRANKPKSEVYSTQEIMTEK